VPSCGRLGQDVWPLWPARVSGCMLSDPVLCVGTLPVRGGMDLEMKNQESWGSVIIAPKRMNFYSQSLSPLLGQKQMIA
jgi:hypothetical protein